MNNIQRYSKTQTLVTHIEYWKHSQEERYIPCSDGFPEIDVTRCVKNSIGSYLEVHQKKGMRYPKITLKAFCESHIPKLYDKTLIGDTSREGDSFSGAYLEDANQ